MFSTEWSGEREFIHLLKNGRMKKIGDEEESEREGVVLMNEREKKEEKKKDEFLI